MVTRNLALLILASCPPVGASALALAPDEPRAPPTHYSSVTAGSKSYRPVAPMPWGDANRRVSPVERAPEGGGAQQTPQRQETPAQSVEPSHKQHR